MLKNWVLTSIRALLRNKTYTLINVVGLALGVSSSLVIFLLLKYDLNFDAFHVHRERIFRVNLVDVSTAEEFAGTPFPLATALPADFPEIEKVVQIYYQERGQINVFDALGAPERYLEDEGIAFVEQEYFDVFFSDWLAGDPNAALAQPNSAVLTESLARKYFGDDSPLGRRINLNNQLDLQVTGVIRDFPANTDFPFTLLISYPSLKGFDSGYDRQAWGFYNSAHQTFVRLPAGMPPDAIEARFTEFTRKHRGERSAELSSFALQPLTEIHYDTRGLENFTERTISRETLFTIGLIALLLIVTACINFINLATAQAVRRSREVGIRKVVGGLRQQLIGQFLLETAFITVCALVLAVATTEFFLANIPAFIAPRAGLRLGIDADAWLFLAGTGLVVILISGLYPAIILSRFSPIQALQSTASSPEGGGVRLRKGLVAVQFVISQILIICTLIAGEQMSYFLNKPLGFETEAIVNVPIPEQESGKLDVLRRRLQAIPEIEAVSFGIGAPTTYANMITGFSYDGFVGEERPEVEIKYVDENYVDTYGLHLLAGESFRANENEVRVVANEAVLREMGIDDPVDAIGKYVRYSRHDATIAGVVEDFHTQSLRWEIAPTMLVYRPAFFRQAGLKIRTDDFSSVLTQVEREWSDLFPAAVFSYEFLDSAIAELYEEEARISSMIQLFAGIAIFIACLGLYGLVSFMVNQKTKEIGIRKVLSASIASIVMLFMRSFSRILLAAFVVAAPVAYFFMNNWLQNFSYRIDVGVGVFGAAFAITLIIAVLTVGYKSVKAALANPVDALRCE